MVNPLESAGVGLRHERQTLTGWADQNLSRVVELWRVTQQISADPALVQYLGPKIVLMPLDVVWMHGKKLTGFRRRTNYLEKMFEGSVL